MSGNVVEITMAGCRLEPLGSYLRGLGAFRVLAEQADHDATCHWKGDTLVIRSVFDREAMLAFFLDRYEPSPVLSPWNRDAGFKEPSAKQSTNTQSLCAVEQSDDPRLGRYRQAIAVVREVMRRDNWSALPKEEQVTVLRNELPDDALEWLDAAVVLRPDGPAFPPLLGSGGNLGRLELSPNFMERVMTVLDRDPTARARSRAWLVATLFDEGSPQLRGDSAGQYDPGAAGGVRAGPTGKASALTNPWDLVLLIEAALLWAAGVARRLGGTAKIAKTASIPFTVAPTPAGYASNAREESLGKAKAEIWAPVWKHHLGIESLRRLFSEGRISWTGRQAGSGTDAVRALSSLGVSAGLDRFVRHVIAERMGQSPLAVTVGTHPVRHRSEVSLLADLDPWCGKVRDRARAPGAPASLVRAALQIDRAMFEAAMGGAERLQALLTAVADAETQVGRTDRARREGAVAPVPWLDPRRWVTALDDGSAEFRLAVSMCLGRDERAVDSRYGVLRYLVTPTKPRDSARLSGTVDWSLDPGPVHGFGIRPIVDVMADVLALRCRMERKTLEGSEETPGVEPWFPQTIDAGSDDAELLACGLVDMDRLGNLMKGLILLRPEPWIVEHRLVSKPAATVSPEWRLLAPFFSRHSVRVNGTSTRLYPLGRWSVQIASGSYASVCREALVRLRMAGLNTIVRSLPTGADGIPGSLLAASLLASPPRRDVAEALRSVARADDQPEEIDGTRSAN